MPRNKYQTVTVLPPASQFGRGESVIYQGEVLTSDGTNWTSQTGPLSYTAETLPDPDSLPAGTSAIVGGQEIQVAEGVWQGKRRAVFVKTGSETDSAFNTLQIQTALNLGGIVEVVGNPGKVYIDKSVNTVACLVHPSFTTLVVPDYIELTVVSNCGVPLIVTSSMRDWLTASVSPISLSWTSGTSFTVNLNGHGFNPGEYVCIYKTNIANTDSIQFAGCFPVDTVTGADSFTVKLRRAGVASPTNTTQWACVKATTGARLYGGILNFNYTGNNSISGNINTICAIYAFAAECEIKPHGFKDTNKFCVYMSCVANWSGVKVHGIKARSDGLKIYGPAYGISGVDIHGSFGDDAISTQSYEAPLYQYAMTTWGDVQNISVDKVDATSTTAGAVVYTNSVGFGHTDNVTFGKISSNMPAKVIGQADSTGDVGFVDFGTIFPRPRTTPGSSENSLAISNCYIDHIKVKFVQDMNSAQQGIGLSASAYVSRIDAALDVNTTYSLASFTFFQLDGSVDKIEITGKWTTGGQTRMLVTPTSAAKYVKNVHINGLVAKNAERLVHIPSGPTVPTIVTLTNNELDAVSFAVQSASTTAVCRVRASANNINAMTNGLARVNAAGATLQFKDSGDNYLSGGSVLTTAPAGTISAWS